MPFGRCGADSRIRLALLTVAAAACWATQGAAQVYYNGYDIGPDYGAMLNQELQRGQQLDREMQARTADIVQRTMQNPDCYAKYQQHLAQGGTLSYPQFAYQYAATGGFTPDGIQRYRRSEQQNQQKEHQAGLDWQRAQRERGQAQQQNADRYSRNQNQAGDVLQGRSWWIDPTTGHYFDDTKRYVDALDISEGERAAIFEGNARRVFPRLDAQLKARGL